MGATVINKAWFPTLDAETVVERYDEGKDEDESKFWMRDVFWVV